MNVLIIHHVPYASLRATTREYLNAYRRYLKARCFYFNSAFGSLPRSILAVQWHLIIFDHSFFESRWDRDAFLRAAGRVRLLKAIEAPKVALPQDEFMNADLIESFIRDFRVQSLLTLSPESEWKKIYPALDPKKVAFERVLPGYLDEAALHQIQALAQKNQERDLDIGYRTASPWPWAGSFNLLKRRLGEELIRRASKAHLKIDCKVGAEHFFWGDDWYRFLLRSRYTLSVEGGASLLDRDGRTSQKVKQYLREKPEASFEEIERACFPGQDGSLHYVAISPRHLEACATRTCQILVEGSYNGILQPGRHYIPLKRDLSNFEQVLETLSDENRRQEITSNAHRDIVESGRFTYRGLMQILRKKGLPDGARTAASELKSLLVWLQLNTVNAVKWSGIVCYFQMLRSIKRIVPARVWEFLKKMKPRQISSAA